MTGTTSTEETSAGLPSFAFLRCTVDLDEHCEVAAVTQSGCNRGTVRREAVRCDLETRRRSSQPQTFNENVRGGLIALAQRDIEHEFVIPFYRDEGVGIAKARIVFGANALIFAAHIAPQPDTRRNDQLAARTREAATK